MRAILRLGRYALYRAIASGGMATVHLGRMLGGGGFKRTVAIKRLHPHIALDPEFNQGFLDEAHLAARIRHTNVVATYDVVFAGSELFLVMEYVPGESLARLLKSSIREGLTVSPSIVSSVVCGTLHGLHAAHEATTEAGEPLHLVHRDVSPQNILVGTDGIARVLDFGVAKAVGRLQSTQDGRLKGKLSYMAPEQLCGERVDRRTDVFAAGIVLWEALTGRKLFTGETEAATVSNVWNLPIQRPSAVGAAVDEAVDAVVMRALERDPTRRFSNARQMALALEAAVSIASPAQVEAWLLELAGDALKKRASEVAEIENGAGEVEMPAAELREPPAAELREPMPPPSRRLRSVVFAGVALLLLVVGASFVRKVAVEAPTTELATASAPRDQPSVAEPSRSAPFAVASTSPTVDASVVVIKEQPSRRNVKFHAAKSAGPPSPTRDTKVMEYVGADGVTYFCRPPNCPN